MSTAGRKARKARQRAGEEKYFKAPKVGTPVRHRRRSVDAMWALINREHKANRLSKQDWRKAGAAIDAGKRPTVKIARLFTQKRGLR